MAYTTIDDPSEYFQTKIYAGTGSAQSLTNDGNSNLKPDWIWFKNRSTTSANSLIDSSRGASVRLKSDSSDAESSASGNFVSFDTDGFSVTGTGSGYNTNSENFVAWQWKAGGSTPTKTYKVVVVSDSGNKYRFRNSSDTATFAQSAVTLDLQEGGTYIFDQSDSSNSGHPLRFSTTSNGTHGGGSEYTTGVTTSGTAGNAGAFTQITVAASAPTLYYYCTQHSAMGGQVNTNSTHGQTNFDGDILSVVQENTRAGFSIVTYSGASNATADSSDNSGAYWRVGHGLGSVPKVALFKSTTHTDDWYMWHHGFSGASKSDGDHIVLNTTSAMASASNILWGNTEWSTKEFEIGGWKVINRSGQSYIGYLFDEVKGYSKFGSYTGNGNADGTFVYTGFKPAWLLIKITNTSNSYDHWIMIDNKRETINARGSKLYANESSAETDDTDMIDILSNGFKQRTANSNQNGNGSVMIYMAFAEHPFVSSKGVPTTAV